MRVVSVFDQTSGVNAALDTGQLVLPSTVDYGTPDALVVLYEPSGAAAAGNIEVRDIDFNAATAQQIVAMPADALPHNFTIGQNSTAPAAGRNLASPLAYVPSRVKFVVPAAGVGVTVHLKVYAVFYR